MRAHFLSIYRARPREREVLGGEMEEGRLCVAQRGGSECQDQEEGTAKQVTARPAHQGTRTHPTNDTDTASAAPLQYLGPEGEARLCADSLSIR